MPLKLKLLIAKVHVDATVGAKAKRLPGGDAKHRVGAVAVDAGPGESLGIVVHADNVPVAHLDFHRPRRLISL